MIIFFYGTDTFRLKEKTQEVLKHYLEKNSGFNFVSFNCLEDKINKGILQSSLFQGKKLILIEDLFKSKENKNKFLEQINNFINSENIVLISEDQNLNEKDELVKLLLKNKSQKFEPFKPFQIKAWIAKRANIDPEAADLLAQSRDLWQINNDLEKLKSFCQNKKITKKDVLLLTTLKTETDIFKTIEAIAERDKNKAFQLIHNHLEKGDNPLYLLTMIAYQFKNLIILKELQDQGLAFDELVKKSKLPFFVVKKTLPVLPKFSFLELKNIYYQIFQIDNNIKIGKIEAEAGLDVLISNI